MRWRVEERLFRCPGRRKFLLTQVSYCLSGRCWVGPVAADTQLRLSGVPAARPRNPHEPESLRRLYGNVSFQLPRTPISGREASITASLCKTESGWSGSRLSSKSRATGTASRTSRTPRYCAAQSRRTVPSQQDVSADSLAPKRRKRKSRADDAGAEQTLAIELDPKPAEAFKKALLREKRAWIVEFHGNGKQEMPLGCPPYVGDLQRPQQPSEPPALPCR